MTTLNRNFLTFGGEPITGRAPTNIRVYSQEGLELSDDQRAMVEHAYKLFCDAVLVSANPNGYHLQNRQLPDGTRIRMESNSGMDRVMVWPTEGGRIPFWTFYCIPFDETFVNASEEAPMTETYYLWRWKNMLYSPASSVLNGLKKAKPEHFNLYTDPWGEDSKKASHPGNQTWFALQTDPELPKHKHADYVLSWWGQNKRHAESWDDIQLLGGNAWGRSFRQDNKNWYSIPDDETTYNVTPPVQSLSVGGLSGIYDNTYTNPTENNYRDKLFINGMGVVLPSQFTIMSACIATRDNKSYVRVVVSGSQAYPTHIYEIGLRRFFNAAKDGVKLDDITAWDEYVLPDFEAAFGVGFTFKQFQPPYWNSSGTEAMGYVACQRNDDATNDATLLYTITQEMLDFSLAALEWSEHEYTHTRTRTEDETVAGTLNYSVWGLFGEKTFTELAPRSGSRNRTISDDEALSFSGAKVLAADYFGDARRILKTTYSETYLMAMDFSEDWSQTVARSIVNKKLGLENLVDAPTYSANVYDHYIMTGSSESLATITSRTVSIVRQSALLLNDAVVASSTQTGSKSASSNYAQNYEVTDGGYADHNFPSPNAPNEPNRTVWMVSGYSTDGATGTFTHTQSNSLTGYCASYGFVAGDLRGRFVVLHESPQYMVNTPSFAPSGEISLFIDSPDLELVEKTGTLSMTQTFTRTGWNNVYVSDAAVLSGERGYEWDSTLSLTGGYTETVAADFGKVVVLDLQSGALSDAGAVTTDTATTTSYTSFVPVNATRTGGQTIPGGYNLYTGWMGTGFGSDVSFGGMGYAGRYDTTDTGAGRHGDCTSAVLQNGVTTTTTGYDVLLHTGVGITESSFGTGEMSVSELESGNAIFTYDGYGDSFNLSPPAMFSPVASAISPDSRIEYLGATSVTGYIPGQNPSRTRVKIDKWYVNGAEVTPDQAYPYTGEFKLLSSPVFVGPLPPKRYNNE